MCRLISAIRIRLLKTRQRAADQHIADLEKMLSELVSARDTINAEITETTRRLLIARDVRSTLSRNRTDRHGTPA